LVKPGRDSPSVTLRAFHALAPLMLPIAPQSQGPRDLLGIRGVLLLRRVVFCRTLFRTYGGMPRIIGLLPVFWTGFFPFDPPPMRTLSPPLGEPDPLRLKIFYLNTRPRGPSSSPKRIKSPPPRLRVLSSFRFSPLTSRCRFVLISPRETQLHPSKHADSPLQVGATPPHESSSRSSTVPKRSVKFASESKIQTLVIQVSPLKGSSTRNGPASPYAPVSFSVPPTGVHTHLSLMFS